MLAYRPRPQHLRGQRSGHEAEPPLEQILHGPLGPCFQVVQQVLSHGCILNGERPLSGAFGDLGQAGRESRRQGRRRVFAQAQNLVKKGLTKRVRTSTGY